MKLFHMECSMFCEQVFAQFEHIHTLIEKLTQPLLQEYGLNSLSAMLLFGIGQEEGIRIGALQKKLHLNQGNLSSLCKKLEQEGFLSRTRKKEDERIVTLSLTEKGVETLENLMEGLQKLDQKMEHYDEAKRQSVIQGLDDFAKMMESILEGE